MLSAFNFRKKLALVTSVYNSTHLGNISFLTTEEERERAFLQVKWLQAPKKKLDENDDIEGETIKLYVLLILLPPLN